MEDLPDDFWLFQGTLNAAANISGIPFLAFPTEDRSLVSLRPVQEEKPDARNN